MGHSEQGVGGYNSVKLGCPVHLLGHSPASQGTPRLVLHWLVHLGLFLLALLTLVCVHGSGTGLISVLWWVHQGDHNHWHFWYWGFFFGLRVGEVCRECI